MNFFLIIENTLRKAGLSPAFRLYSGRVSALRVEHEVGTITGATCAELVDKIMKIGKEGNR